MASLAIRNGHLICPAQGVDGPGDLLIRDGKIAALGGVDGRYDAEVDATGLIVAPGLIDIHVHLREPGYEAKETIASGLAAAVAGGFTSVACMPNTVPALDRPAVVELIGEKARRAELANVYPIAAITRDRAGHELVDFEALCECGCVAFSDDGDAVADPELMRAAFVRARELDRPLAAHCEDKALVGNGAMHEGDVSAALGLPGMPRAAEDRVVERDIRLAEETQAKVHICHVSTAGAVELVRRAKGRGAQVTAEAAPHHLCLTDECVRSRDAVYKMNPPLRTAADVAAVREGLRDGTIDAIASDHAPHTPAEKQQGFVAAPFGVVGLETVLPIVVTELIQPGVLSWSDAIARLATSPAKVFGLPKGTLQVGADADVVLIDPGYEWQIDSGKFRSKGRNCPFQGRTVRGRAAMVIVRGEVRLDRRTGDADHC